jgi:hypothetical protein
MSSVFLYASASPSRKAGCLLMFPVSADLKFPQSPFGSNAEFFQQPLAVYVSNSTKPMRYVKYPKGHLRSADHQCFTWLSVGIVAIKSR